MMRNELQERIDHQLREWEWTMAEYIYMNDDTIHDVGGKEEIAAIVNAGYQVEDKYKWWKANPIVKRYNELNGPEFIVKSESDLYSTWDVVSTGYCKNDKPKSIYDVIQAVQNQYKAKYPELQDAIDYFSIGDVIKREDSGLWPAYKRIAVFYVKGGSEGYYVHIETLDGTHTCHGLIKTLREGELGRAWAEKTVCAISRIMEV